MSIYDAGAVGSGQLTAFACRQAEQIPDFHRRHRRFLRFVDTHQRWLLVHLLADCCAGGGQAGAAVNGITDRAGALGIASRNTTLAFLGQLAAYGYLERRHCHADRRIKLVTPTAETRAILADWAVMLQASLAPEAVEEAAEPGSDWPAYLAIAAALLGRQGYLSPPADVRLTQDMRGGWLVMSHMLRHVQPAEAGLERVIVRNFNAPGCASTFGLARSTVYRLLRLATDAAIMGSGIDARVPFWWLSGYHIRQYCRWNGHLLEAAQAARRPACRDDTSLKGSPEISRATAPAIRAPATSFA